MTNFRELRAAAAEHAPGDIPCGAARSQPFPGTLRAKLVDVDGQSFYQLEGYASVVERGYQMYDIFGPYTEIIDAGAFDKTLAADPDVAFLMNHRGITMARTTQPGRLELSADETGLKVMALVNPKRQDVKDMVTAIQDGDITEMSFAFWINAGGGHWNADYTEYRITETDINRGDVSAVNYGANPYTSIAARSREILDALDRLPAGARQAAMQRLEAAGTTPSTSSSAATGRQENETAETGQGRADSEPEPQGRSIALVSTLLRSFDDDED